MNLISIKLKLMEYTKPLKKDLILHLKESKREKFKLIHLQQK